MKTFYDFRKEKDEILDTLAARLGAPGDQDWAFSVLRSVIRVLRNTIPIEDSFDILSHLPIFLRAVYLDSWDINYSYGHIYDIDQFIELVKLNNGGRARSELGSSAQILDATLVVLEMLRENSKDSLADVKDVFIRTLQAKNSFETTNNQVYVS